MSPQETWSTHARWLVHVMPSPRVMPSPHTRSAHAMSPHAKWSNHARWSAPARCHRPTQGGRPAQHGRPTKDGWPTRCGRPAMCYPVRCRPTRCFHPAQCHRPTRSGRTTQGGWPPYDALAPRDVIDPLKHVDMIDPHGAQSARGWPKRSAYMAHARPTRSHGQHPRGLTQSTTHGRHPRQLAHEQKSRNDTSIKSSKVRLKAPRLDRVACLSEESLRRSESPRLDRVAYLSEESLPRSEALRLDRVMYQSEESLPRAVACLCIEPVWMILLGMLYIFFRRYLSRRISCALRRSEKYLFDDYMRLSWRINHQLKARLIRSTEKNRSKLEARSILRSRLKRYLSWTGVNWSVGKGSIDFIAIDPYEARASSTKIDPYKALLDDRLSFRQLPSEDRRLKGRQPQGSTPQGSTTKGQHLRGRRPQGVDNLEGRRLKGRRSQGVDNLKGLHPKGRHLRGRRPQGVNDLKGR
ncbi:30S ribosomal protein S4 [Striga asiatica]|uniref:30S ribosomal protein S4 n=1 Tax=Striga asiatica TaxID=4170 RepID=A0A5A7PBC3_STRAF|nr:30S ribosomal protein S4 [Striga asiatica]